MHEYTVFRHRGIMGRHNVNEPLWCYMFIRRQGPRDSSFLRLIPSCLPNSDTNVSRKTRATERLTLSEVCLKGIDGHGLRPFGLLTGPCL